MSILFVQQTVLPALAHQGGDKNLKSNLKNKKVHFKQSNWVMAKKHF